MAEFFHQNLSYFLSGISVGGQYALIAIGYTMVYGILRLINFAHGDVFMCAGLIMVYLSASLPFVISVPLVLILTVALGFIIERVAYRPLRSAPRMSVMISAIGVSYLLQNAALYFTGGLAKVYPALPVLHKSRHDSRTCADSYPCCSSYASYQTHKDRNGYESCLEGFRDQPAHGYKDQPRYLDNLHDWFSSCSSCFPPVLHELCICNPHKRIYAWSESICCGSIRWYRVNSGSGHWSLHIIKGGASIFGIPGSGWTTFSDAFTFAFLIVILIVKPTGLFGEKAVDKV